MSDPSELWFTQRQTLNCYARTDLKRRRGVSVADSDVDVPGDLVEPTMRDVSPFASATSSAFRLLDNREDLVAVSINLRRTNPADG